MLSYLEGPSTSIKYTWALQSSYMEPTNFLYGYMGHPLSPASKGSVRVGLVSLQLDWSLNCWLQGLLEKIALDGASSSAACIHSEKGTGNVKSRVFVHVEEPCWKRVQTRVALKDWQAL